MSSYIQTRNSPIHGKGVFALRKIRKGKEIIEYKGRRCTHEEVDGRDEEDNGHTFLFTLNDDYVIDAAIRGNAARWINHSCKPNCEPVLVEDADGNRKKDRVVIEAKRDIKPGEELSYDYGIETDERLTKKLLALWACRCGNKNCRGTLLNPEKKKKKKGSKRG